MDDQDFFDHLHQVWSKTTGAEDRYWMPEEFAELFDGYKITAVGQNDERETVAMGLTEADADFITAVHGCLPDLVRRLNMAIDESDRLDEELDTTINRVAELELEADEFAGVVSDLQGELASALGEVNRLRVIEWQYEEPQR